MWHCHPTNGSKVNRTEQEEHLWAVERCWQQSTQLERSGFLTAGTPLPLWLNLRNEGQLQCGGKKGKMHFGLLQDGQDRAPPDLTKGGKRRVSGVKSISDGVVALSLFTLPPWRTACCQICFIFKDCHWDNNDHTWFYYLNNTLRIIGLDLQSSFWERKEMCWRTEGKKAFSLVHVVQSTKHQLPAISSQLGTNVLVWLVKLILLAGFLINDTQTKNGEKLCEHILIRSKKKYH